MELYQLVYLANVINGFNILLQVLTLASFTVLVVLLIMELYSFQALRDIEADQYRDGDAYEPGTPNNFKVPYQWVVIFILTAVVSIIIPSDRVIYTMVGVELVQNVAESERAQRVTEQLLDLIERKLNEDLREEEVVDQQPPEAQDLIV